MMSTHRLRRRHSLLTVVVLCCFLSGACHSHERIALPDASTTGATTPKKGDHLRATLVNGNILNFTLSEIQADALAGTDGERVLYRDIARLDQKHLSKGRTAALVAGVAVAGFALLVVVALASDPFIYY